VTARDPGALGVGVLFSFTDDEMVEFRREKSGGMIALSSSMSERSIATGIGGRGRSRVYGLVAGVLRSVGAGRGGILELRDGAVVWTLPVGEDGGGSSGFLDCEGAEVSALSVGARGGGSSALLVGRGDTSVFPVSVGAGRGGTSLEFE
jgi:hypothetical protein